MRPPPNQIEYWFLKAKKGVKMYKPIKLFLPNLLNKEVQSSLEKKKINLKYLHLCFHTTNHYLWVGVGERFQEEGKINILFIYSCNVWLSLTCTNSDKF